MLKKLILPLVFVVLCNAQANAELVIDVQGVAQPTPVAIVPFGWQGSSPSAPLDVAQVITDDLRRSGRFSPIAERDMLQKPTDGADVDFQDWGFVGVEAVVVGSLVQTGANAYTLEFHLFDVFGRRELVGYRMPASRGTMRGAAHRVADMIYEKLTGIKGVFGTKVPRISLLLLQPITIGISPISCQLPLANTKQPRAKRIHPYE